MLHAFQMSASKRVKGPESNSSPEYQTCSSSDSDQEKDAVSHRTFLVQDTWMIFAVT